MMGGWAVVSRGQIDQFWKRFVELVDRIGDRFENRRIVDEIDRLVCEFGNITWEFGPGFHDENARAFVLSPSGDPDLLPVTREIVAAAPDCPGWEFHPAKPVKRWDRIILIENRDGTTAAVDVSNARYVLLRHPDGMFTVLIADQQLSELPAEQQRTAAEILLDGELGEDLRMTAICEVDVQRELDNHNASAVTAIEHIREHVLSLK